MKKTLTVLGAIAFLLITALAVAAPHHGPDEVVIKGAADKQPAVTFPHAKHQEMVKACDTCHHTNKGMTTAEGTEVKACSECHLDPKGDVPSMRQMSMKKNPFHIVCIDCHKTETKGPTKCAECHKK